MSPRLESKIQRDFIRWVRDKYPDLIVFSVPNGAYSPYPQHISRLKGEGLTPGVPDVFILKPTSRFHGMAIEFKVGRNQPSQEQVKVITELKRLGYFVIVAYSAEEAFENLEKYLREEV